MVEVADDLQVGGAVAHQHSPLVEEGGGPEDAHAGGVEAAEVCQVVDALHGVGQRGRVGRAALEEGEGGAERIATAEVVGEEDSGRHGGGCDQEAARGQEGRGEEGGGGGAGRRGERRGGGGRGGQRVMGNGGMESGVGSDEDGCGGAGGGEGSGRWRGHHARQWRGGGITALPL